MHYSFKIMTEIEEVNTKESHKGREHRTKINGYATKIGVLDANNSTSCYIHFGGYVKPLPEKDLNKSMTSFERKLRFWIDDAAKQLLNGKLRKDIPIIKNVDWSSSELRTNITRVNNVYSYFSIELTLFFADKVNVHDENQLDRLLLLSYSLSDYLDENQDLSFKPTRS